MPSVTGLTAERMQAIEDAVIESAAIVAGHLIFTRHNGSTYDAGDVNGGQQIPHIGYNAVQANSGQSQSTSFVALGVPLTVSGFQKYRADTKLVVQAFTGVYNNLSDGFYEVACRISGTDTVLFNGYGPDDSKAGLRVITGLAAGTYSISLVKRTGLDGVGIAIDGSNFTRNELMVTETF
jgi:hypothetical protein